MEWLRLVWNKIKDCLRKIHPKHILLGSLAILLLFIPSFLAAWCRQTIDNQSDSFSVSLYEQDGTLIVSESGLLESAGMHSLLDTFYKIQTNKKEISMAPGNPSADRYILATTTLNGASSTLKCYFSTDGGNDYLTDQNGKIYSISPLYTKNYLTSIYAASFYDHSIPPTLMTLDNETIVPSKVTWNYSNIDNRFISPLAPMTESQQKTYDMTGAIGLHFSIDPDLCAVSVYDQSRLVYQGSLQGLSQITVNSGSELTLRIDATWKQKADSKFYGTMQYHFSIRIRNRSLFRISSDRVYPGEWVLLTGTNVTDPEKIQFSASWCPSPVFYHKENTVYTLLPIPDQTDATSLRFEISHGASAQSFMIALSAKKPSDTSINSSAFRYPSLLLPNTLHDYSVQISSLSADVRHLPYFRGTFVDPLSAQFRIGYRHGENAITDDSSGLRLLGTEFVSGDGTTRSVPALNHGIVIQSSYSDSMGAYIVLDHGCGLRTWYCHLSRADVSVGDVVQKGQSIGQSGVAGIATGNGFLLLCTINQTIIDPTYLIGKEIRY